MYHLYKTTQSSSRRITPKEIKLLKYLLNISRRAVLSIRSPKELHKWIKIMLDAYHLRKEESEIREAKKMNQPIVIQKLFILKQDIEEEYLEKDVNAEMGEESDES